MNLFKTSSYLNLNYQSCVAVVGLGLALGLILNSGLYGSLFVCEWDVTPSLWACGEGWCILIAYIAFSMWDLSDLLLAVLG